MKQKLMTHYCLDKECGYEETTHKIRDGLSCPKCNGPTGVRPAHRTERKCLGYDNKECSNCGRVRVEKYSDGSRICEKCNWDQTGDFEVREYI